jgi:tetratricopeptide (TPR) repeat protein
MRKALWLLLLGAYAVVVMPLSDHLRNRPVVVKLGYTPSAEVLEAAAGDHRYAVAESAVLKVLFYFGSLVGKWKENIIIRPEYYNMFKTLETAVKLDPYNQDAYYFAQAAFTWEVGRVKEVNALLDHGMKYRTWDWTLPFYAGFNEAYFLKDYQKAGAYMRKAAEISGNPLFTNLAARYFYEAGHAELGLVFLDGMIAQAKDPKVRAVYQMRKEALLAVGELEKAVEKFRAAHGRPPGQLQDLVAAGLLAALPKDPYGGEFFLDPSGKVRTTSKFASLEATERQPASASGMRDDSAVGEPQPKGTDRP